MSFNEDSQMPEHAQGHDEIAGNMRGDEDQKAAEPSGDVTDRFGLQAQGKGYLLRKYNIEMSRANQPYFSPVDSLLKAFVADADDALAEARTRIEADKELSAEAVKIAELCVPYFEAMIEKAGEDREWLARSMVIWPLTDQVGYQLYKATSGEADLIDYAGYLARTDADVKAQGAAALETHEAFQKRQFWTDLAYRELGFIDMVIGLVDPDSTSYNFEAIIRQGYQSAANLDTRNHLRGVQGSSPVTDDQPLDEFKSQVLASRRAASQAA